jgi:hypothetical protein
MNRQELKSILLAAARPQANINFSDAQSAAKNALNDYLSTSQTSVRDLRPGSATFAIIEEVLDEVIPQAVEDRTQAFAEIRNFSRNDQVKFDVRTSYASRRRMYKAIKKGARGGVYKAYRLDGYSLTMNTEVYTVGYFMTLEELLLGTRTVAELINIIADAFTEKVFVEVIEALQAASLAAPSVNRTTSATDEFNPASLDAIIRIISAYGNPVIMGFRKELGLLNNALGSDFSLADYDDIRAQGYVGIYKGTPLVELPNYLIQHAGSTAQFLFTEGTIYIMPANERPVKVAFQGESYTTEFMDPQGGREWQNHRMMGVTVLFNEAIGSYIFTPEQ